MERKWGLTRNIPLRLLRTFLAEKQEKSFSPKRRGKDQKVKRQKLFSNPSSPEDPFPLSIEETAGEINIQTPAPCKASANETPPSFVSASAKVH